MIYVLLKVVQLNIHTIDYKIEFLLRSEKLSHMNEAAVLEDVKPLYLSGLSSQKFDHFIIFLPSENSIKFSALFAFAVSKLSHG